MTTETTRIFTKDEIKNAIEALTEPGGTIFFFLAGSPCEGGPLERGAAVVELNPNYPGKKQHKYNLYVSNVENNEPAGKRMLLFDSDKSKTVAEWIKERHYIHSTSHF